MTRTLIAFTDSRLFGGAEQALLRLLAGLNRQQWHPVLAHHNATGLEPLLNGARKAGIELWAVPEMSPGQRGITPTIQFAQALRNRKPDVFHAHLTWQYSCRNALIASVLANVPARVATVQLTIDVTLKQRDAGKLQWLAKRIGRYIAVSNHVARHLNQTTGIPLNRIEVIHNAVSLPVLPVGDALNPDEKFANRMPVVLSVARLDSQKGLYILLEAAALVPETHFVIAGEGSERAALQEQIARLGLSERVQLLGYRSDVQDLLSQCNLFVLPSFYEGLPLAMLEAMATGKPVVASAVGGIPEAITSGVDGILVPSGDAGALAGAIRNVLSNPEQARRLGLSGRHRIETDFSEKNMIARVSNVYETLLAKRSRELATA